MTADATSSLSPYRLTRQHRWEACIHEAGHAIVAALGGYPCRYIAVAPEGTVDWLPTNNQGLTLTNLWGFCTTDCYCPPLGYLRWSEEECRYDTDAAHDAQRRYLKSGSPLMRALYRQGLRAMVCHNLAGLLAEALERGETAETLDLESYWDYPESPDDLSQALAYCDLLPRRWYREFEHAQQTTSAVLKDYWPVVKTLAEALEQAGHLSEEAVFPYLPPPLGNWPLPPSRSARSSL